MTEAYKWHRAGSRKGQVHKLFDEEGFDMAHAAGLRMGLKPETLKTWLTSFPGEDERFQQTGQWQSYPTGKSKEQPGIAKPQHSRGDTTDISSGLSESAMEDQIAQSPERFLREPGLQLVGRQVRVGQYRFDLMFTDRHGTRLIVELQNGTLDRNHLYKILDYYDAYKERNPTEFVDVMIIANIIPAERKRRLHDRGIAFLELPMDRFG